MLGYIDKASFSFDRKMFYALSDIFLPKNRTGCFQNHKMAIKFLVKSL